MPKTHRAIPTPQPETSCAFIPTESPVSGVDIELATLLMQAIKSRRKFLSKSSAPAPASASSDAEKEALREGALRGLQNAADDKTTSFLYTLRRQVERSSEAASGSSSSRRMRASPNAPVRCIEFLSEVLSDASNSFHLRRSALAMTREILARSSDARAFFALGRSLLDFVSVVEAVENDQEADEDGNDDGEPGSSSNDVTPKVTFQLEAMELVHHLASEFGRFYAQFTVASQLLGDVSVNFSMRNHRNSNSDDFQNRRAGRHRSRHINMRMLRRERDIALEHGPKACQSLEKMIEEADGYFRVLVPRFGGFNVDSPDGLEKHENHTRGEDTAKIDSVSSLKMAVVSDGLTSIDHGNGIDHDDKGDDSSVDWEEGDANFSDNTSLRKNSHEPSLDLNDTASSLKMTADSDGSNLTDCGNGVDQDEDVDGSINWEEGDANVFVNANLKKKTHQTSLDFNDNRPNRCLAFNNHQAAVEETMDLMGRAGALLDGELAVQIGGGKSIQIENTMLAAPEPSVLATSSTMRPEIHAETHIKLKNMVKKNSQRHLPRLNRWIHALSHADGMEERAVADPATARVTGREGPTSLVLLSEAKRTLRRELLQRMMKLREEIEGVLQSARALVISPGGAGNKHDADTGTGEDLGHSNKGGVPPENGNPIGMKRPWMPTAQTLRGIRKKKKSKTSRFKVVYRKR